MQVVAIEEFGLSRAGEQVGFVSYQQSDVCIGLAVVADLGCHVSIDARLRIERRIELAIGPAIDVQEEWRSALPDVRMDRHGKTIDYRRSENNHSLIGIAGIKRRREI